MSTCILSVSVPVLDNGAIDQVNAKVIISAVAICKEYRQFSSSDT